MQFHQAGRLVVILILPLIAAGIARSAPTDPPPMKANQVSITVRQSGVPQSPSKDGTPPDKVIAITVNLTRIGNCDGHVTLKTTFVGHDVTNKNRVINFQKTQSAEALPGSGGSCTIHSKPFTYTPPSIDKKTKKKTPATGTQPDGWIVRIFQDGKLLSATSSTPELIPWIEGRSK